MSSAGVYRGILVRAPKFDPSASATVTHVVSFDARAHKLALKVAVKAPHGQGMDWAWTLLVTNLLEDFGTSRHMISGIAPLGPWAGVGEGKFSD
jgi:hypothetical protein